MFYIILIPLTLVLFSYVMNSLLMGFLSTVFLFSLPLITGIFYQYLYTKLYKNIFKKGVNEQ